MIVKREKEEEQQDQLTTGQLWVRAVPAITLLVLVVFGSKLNNLIGIKPVSYTHLYNESHGGR